MQAKKRKLEEQFDKDCVNNAKQHERKSNIFNGISIFVDGYTGKFDIVTINIYNRKRNLNKFYVQSHQLMN